MASQAEVLQEFLMSLGFKLDEVAYKKFDSTIGQVLKSSVAVTKGVTGIMTAAQAMVVAVTYEFERLYYASIKVSDSAKNLQAFSYGARQIGISAESAEGALAGMASAMRTNPGMTALFQSLTGEKPSGSVKSMITLMERLRGMPYFIAAQWAGQFGVPEEMFNQLMQPGALERLQAGEERRIEINKRLGVSVEEMTAKSVEYKNMLRDVTANLDTLSALVASKMIKTFEGLNTFIENMIKHFTGAKDPASPTQFDNKGKPIVPGKAEEPSYMWQLYSQARGLLSNPEWETNQELAKRYTPGEGNLKQRAADTARAHGLPENLFKALIGVESNWNTQAMSDKGAMGLTQLMPVNTHGMNPWNPQENMDRGATLLASIYKQRGNWRDALAAYNTHGENMKGSIAGGYGYADTVLSRADKMGGITINAPISIKIDAPGGDPDQIRAATAGGVEDGMATATRNLLGTAGHGGEVVAGATSP